MPTILGLDLSISNTGLCVINDEKSILELSTTNPVKGKGRDEVITFARIETQLNAVLRVAQAHPVDWIVLEGMSMAQYSSSREVLAYLHGIVKRALHKQGYILEIVPPSVLKKYVTGKGNADKKEMARRVVEEWGLNLDNYKKKDDLAEAYALARMGWDAFAAMSGQALGMYRISEDRKAVLKSRFMLKTAKEIMINKGMSISFDQKEE